MRSPTRLLLAAAVSAALLGACNSNNSATSANANAPAAKPGAAATKEGVAATVNGTAISEAKVAMLLKHMGNQNQAPLDPADARKMIIEQLTMQLLLSQEAANKGLDKKPEVQDQLELTRQSVLSNAYIQDFMTGGEVTEEQLKSEYENLKTKMGGNEYKARHILVEKEDTARDLIAKLKKNPNAFAALAKAQSKDPGSKERGGDLGWFDPRAMVPEFAAALAKLEKGQMSQEPVQSKFGYHIIAVDDTRTKEIPPLDQIKPMLKQQMQQQKVKKLLDDLKAKAKIEIATPPAAPVAAPLAPAAAGGASPADKK